jgi:hypothetical protein
MGLIFSCPAIADKNKVSSLCDTGDVVIFACATTNKKIISLCGKGTEDNPTGIYYRFGRKNRIELTYPEDKGESSFQKFLILDQTQSLSSQELLSEAIVRFQLRSQNIFFNNDGYFYHVYQNSIIGEDKPERNDRGVSVSKMFSSKVIANIKCVSGGFGGWGTYESWSARLKYESWSARLKKVEFECSESFCP